MGNMEICSKRTGKSILKIEQCTNKKTLEDSEEKSTELTKKGQAED